MVVVVSERRPCSAVYVCALYFLLLLQTGNHRNSLDHSVLRLHFHDGFDFVRFYGYCGILRLFLLLKEDLQ